MDACWCVDAEDKIHNISVFLFNNMSLAIVLQCGGIVIAGPIPGWENVAKVRTDVMKEKLEKFAQADASAI
ncbi:hypothetical protein EJB05_01739, partial [Eragrostis curvula]